MRLRDVGIGGISIQEWVLGILGAIIMFALLFGFFWLIS